MPHLWPLIFFSIFATSNIDMFVSILHNIYSMQRILMIKISLEFIPNCPINNILALVQKMAWHRQVTNQCLNQRWLVYRRIYVSLGLKELRYCWFLFTKTFQECCAESMYEGHGQVIMYPADTVGAITYLYLWNLLLARHSSIKISHKVLCANYLERRDRSIWKGNEKRNAFIAQITVFFR